VVVVSLVYFLKKDSNILRAKEIAKEEARKAKQIENSLKKQKDKLLKQRKVYQNELNG
jgi:hypothetical protein